MIELFIARYTWPLAAGAVALTLLLTWDSSRKAKWVEKGKEQVRVEIRKGNDAAVKTSERIRAKSGSSGVRGTRDPNSID
jgi:hypothetical protein